MNTIQGTVVSINSTNGLCEVEVKTSLGSVYAVRMNSLNITPFWLTLELSFWTTLILIFLGIPLAYFLAHGRSKWISLVEALVSLPLVLPPTVLGFYLLLALNKEGFIGSFWYRLFGKQLVFHFEGILIASVIYSLPMMVHPLTASFRSVSKNLIEASYTLGKSKWETLISLCAYGYSSLLCPHLGGVWSGLEEPEEGSIEVKGEVWYDSKRGINLPPQKRDVSFVFQDYVLFPNMSPFENIAFGMKKKDPQKVMELLKLVGLEQLKDKKPSVLSDKNRGWPC